MTIQENINQPTTLISGDNLHDLKLTQFVAVAIPESMEQSMMLKSDLQAYEIPAILEQEITEMDEVQLGGSPVLVPECKFEQASEIIGMIELNAIDDDDDDFDFDDDDFDDDLDEEEDEDDEDWDDDDDNFDDEDEDFDLDDFDEFDEDEDEV